MHVEEGTMEPFIYAHKAISLLSRVKYICTCGSIERVKASPRTCCELCSSQPSIANFRISHSITCKTYST